jgi:hypothetical protein
MICALDEITESWASYVRVPPIKPRPGKRIRN